MQDPLDQLLANLKADPAAPAHPPAAPATALDNLLNQLSTDTQRSVRDTLSQQPRSVPADALLTEIQADYAERDRAARQQAIAAEQQRQRQEHDKQRRLEQLRQQRRAELAQQAAVWLKQLSPKTEEGLWFEEFACSYESRLEAAIDYLEALQEVSRSLH